MGHDALVISVMVAAIVAYPLCMRVLAQRAQPARLEMARLGKALLADPALEPRHKLFVSSLLDDAFDFKSIIVFAVACPFYFLGRGFGWISDADYALPDGEAGRNLLQIATLHMKAIAAANPLFQ